MVAVEPGARRNVSEESGVFGRLGGWVASLGEVGAEHALAPGLGARPLHGQALVPPVQVVDDVVIVVMLVVVQVRVLEEPRPETYQTCHLHKAS